MGCGLGVAGSWVRVVGTEPKTEEPRGQGVREAGVRESRAGGASGVWGSGGRGVRGDHEGFGEGGFRGLRFQECLQ